MYNKNSACILVMHSKNMATNKGLLTKLLYISYYYVGPRGSGAIRLVRDGTTALNYTSGVVQVWWNWQWANICYDDSFDSDEADVICHQLGWSRASSYHGREV